MKLGDVARFTRPKPGVICVLAIPLDTRNNADLYMQQNMEYIVLERCIYIWTCLNVVYIHKYQHEIMGTARKTDTNSLYVLSNFIYFLLHVGKLYLDVMIQPPFLTILLTINNTLIVL